VRVAVTTTGSSATGSAKAGKALNAASNTTMTHLKPRICCLLEVKQRRFRPAELTKNIARFAFYLASCLFTLCLCVKRFDPWLCLPPKNKNPETLR
jgi:hypothetical protein